jgi:hypothetical protein
VRQGREAKTCMVASFTPLANRRRGASSPWTIHGARLMTGALEQDQLHDRRTKSGTTPRELDD